LFNQGETHAQCGIDANGAIAERTFFIRAQVSRKNDCDVEDLKFTVTPRDRNRRIIPCGATGRPKPSIEAGKGPVSIALQNFKAGCVRVYLVPGRCGWRAGDPIDPVLTRKGAICSRLFYHNGSSELIVTLAESQDIPAGSYQFIARAFPPGWHEAEELTLLPDDVVSDRRFASLVVRHPLNQREIAERPLAQRSYFTLSCNFPIGTDVYAALDSGPMPSAFVRPRAAINVIQHSVASRWGASRALNVISGPGIASAQKIVPIVPGCVN
jgi:hypothetical protein